MEKKHIAYRFHADNDSGIITCPISMATHKVVERLQKEKERRGKPTGITYRVHTDMIEALVDNI